MFMLVRRECESSVSNLVLMSHFRHSSPSNISIKSFGPNPLDKTPYEYPYSPRSPRETRP